MIKKRQSGFTLLELALVLAISGLFMMTGAHFLKLYTLNIQHDKTLENTRLALSALKEYYGLTGTYPCPSNPSLEPNDPNYGVSQCRSSANLTANPDNCTGAPAGIGCTSNSARDADGNGNPDIVMMGGLPFRTLTNRVVDTPFNESYKGDGFNSLISYAVTEEMSNTNRYNVINPANPNLGSIHVEDENSISLTVPDSTAHFVIFSHGDNRKGAYSRLGERAEDCTIPSGAGPVAPAPGPSAAGIDVDVENCDRNDAIFVKGIRSLANNSNYNDDTLFFKVSGIVPLWKKSLASTDTETSIYSTNTGSVGVGTNAPSHKLHITGDLSAEVGTLSNNYCDGVDAGTCLQPSAIGGSGSDCAGNNSAAYAIQDNQVVCRTVDWTVPGKTCTDIDVLGTPTPSFMRGVSNLGNLYCCTQTGNNCEEQ